RAEPTVGIDDHSYPASHRRAIDPRNGGAVLPALLADPNRVAVASYTRITNIDIVTPRGQIYTGRIAQSDVVVALNVVLERLGPDRCIVISGRVVKKRNGSNRSIETAGRVDGKNVTTDGRVPLPRRVAKQGLKTDSRESVADSA